MGLNWFVIAHVTAVLNDSSSYMVPLVLLYKYFEL